MASYVSINAKTEISKAGLFNQAMDTLSDEYRNAFRCNNDSGIMTIIFSEDVSARNTILFGALLEAIHMLSRERGWEMIPKLIFEKRNEYFVAADLSFQLINSDVNVRTNQAIHSEAGVRVERIRSNLIASSSLLRAINFVLRKMGAAEFSTSICFRVEASSNLQGPLAQQRELSRLGGLVYRAGLSLPAGGYSAATMAIESVSVLDSRDVAMGAEVSDEELRQFRERAQRGISNYIDVRSVVTFKQNKASR